MGVAGDLNAPAASPLEGFPLSTDLEYAWAPGPVCTLPAVDPDVARAGACRFRPFYYVTYLGAAPCC
jgi:hypothetical protein